MNVRDHGADVARAIWCLAVGRVLDAVEVLNDRWVKVRRIALVEGIDLAPWWDLDLHHGSTGRFDSPDSTME